MSDYIKPSHYSGRALNQQWINGIFTSHDLFCSCDKVIDHLKKAIEETCPRSTEHDGTETTTTTAEEETEITGEDLEKLFEENGEDDER